VVEPDDGRRPIQTTPAPGAGDYFDDRDLSDTPSFSRDDRQCTSTGATAGQEGALAAGVLGALDAPGVLSGGEYLFHSQGR